MKKVLIIAYFFPPLGGGGVQRTLKFVKYLPSFGWKPYVITVKDSNYIHDQTLLQEIPTEAEVYRTDSLEFDLPRKIIQKVFPRRLAAYLLNLIFIPDDKIGWKKFAVKKASEVIEREGIDIIYSTSSPYTGHLVASELKKKYELPWVADFRDEWSQNPFIKYSTPIDKEINKYLERKVLTKADRVISVSEPITEGLASLINKGQKKKFTTITNGFDKEDFYNLKKIQKDSRFTFVHNGSLYGHRTANLFLDSLSALIRENKISKDKVKVYLVGYVDDLELKKHFKEPYLWGVVKTTGWLNHKKSLQYLVGGDVLLLFIGYASGEKPGKIFEYMASGKPILAMVPKGGSAENIIKQTRTGVVVRAEDKRSIEYEILRLYQKWKNGDLKVKPNWGIIENYERRNLTKQLAGIFNQYVKEPDVNRR